MKLLFDENVSRRLARTLASEFPGSTHVTGAALRGAEDWRIWDYARNEGFAIVSKDADFRDRSYVEGAPPKPSRACCGVSASRSSASRRQKNRLS